MAKFNADFYRQFRPYYPSTTFDGIQDRLLSKGFQKPFLIADIGCGTGHSTISFLNSGVHAHVIGVDPDPKMLEHAKNLAEMNQIHGVEFRIGTGESTGIQPNTIDAILIGSAFHWLNARQAKEEFFRVLKSNGILRIFEYQFPKAKDVPELNEWIRRQFNLYWKANNQKPRGTLRQITDVFRVDERFAPLGEGKPLMVFQLTAEDLAGHIFSQSRVLCYEENLSDSEKTQFRREVGQVLNSFFQGKKLAFDFKLSWFEFEKL